jgi:sulfite exporter TauE/SafE
MKRYTLITSIALIVIGFITARVGDNLSTVNESGMIQDSMLMPLGAILFFLGLLALTTAIIWFLVDFIRGQWKKGKA